MRIKEILQTIEALAPVPLQEDFDNCGLQVGDMNREATALLLSLDVTESVIDEAISLGCNLIISHHPLAFKPFKSLTGRTYVERCMIKAIRHDIAIYAAHTNLDNVLQGVNFKLAEMLGLQQLRILSPKRGLLLKLVTFVPESHAEYVRNALFNAGAGNIGNYESCSFNLHGEGTFKAGATANPFVGTVGKLHFEKEVRIETVLPRFKQPEVLRALLSVHPYEEPAYDFYPIENEWHQVGSGVVGVLPEAIPEQEFLYLLKDVFNLPTIRHTKLQNRDIHDVALCGGAGAFLIPQAIAYGADAFVTGEAKYNDFYDVDSRLLLAVVGHYESEVCTKEIFFDAITKKFPTFAVHKSAFDSNPVKYL
ncbi:MULTISPECIES: Nif3-like dinuclear metal center hexameric protein [Petrimonas]|mgnify:CR=1 FL=1|jgi:dinuclear metal center YbgI/SA1388 family protein|uniref:GTP cyclohydrolase 1 type 2 homolog n=1 Tax=Petrimonas mucosa TaxID=1642646 RepID=A0A1G4G9G0_9BACT|nr:MULTISPECIES: Nif3-like dinuclear metal center hexameric protein [Petrimonas]MDD3559976.1 Nif3-like dinuclear metal center hexameric protein [Petrimonas mucosa]SCM59145.1 GTP cyclohydrolase 1 type 2 homolog [Petrimonas mucosa]SFU30930.1 dinuclear metal center protein, YbgI/SA1388 family [Porphyromonadaceae bacterium KHP3R9]HHT30479.1 Nif3-like dinuclear metal center hexameric protein [Petrimonas mucosa]